MFRMTDEKGGDEKTIRVPDRTGTTDLRVAVCPEALLDPCRYCPTARTRRQLRRAQPARQLQQGQPVAVRLGQDPVPDLRSPPTDKPRNLSRGMVSVRAHRAGSQILKYRPGHKSRRSSNWPTRRVSGIIEVAENGVPWPHQKE
jgi:hypothetical protein